MLSRKLKYFISSLIKKFEFLLFNVILLIILYCDYITQNKFKLSNFCKKIIKIFLKFNIDYFFSSSNYSIYNKIIKI